MKHAIKSTIALKNTCLHSGNEWKKQRPTPERIRKPVSVGEAAQSNAAEAPDVPKQELRTKAPRRKPVSIGEVGEAMPNDDEQHTFLRC